MYRDPQIIMEFNPRPYSDKVAYCLARINEASQCFHKNSLKLSFDGANGRRTKPRKIRDLIDLNSIQGLSGQEQQDLVLALSEKHKSFMNACGIKIDGSIGDPLRLSRLGRAVNNDIRNIVEQHEKSRERAIRPEPESSNQKKPEHAIEFIKMAMIRYRSLEGTWLPPSEKISKIGKYIFNASIHEMDDLDLDHLKKYLRDDEKTMLGKVGVQSFAEVLNEDVALSLVDRKVAKNYEGRIGNYLQEQISIEQRQVAKEQAIAEDEAKVMPLFYTHE